MADLLFEALSQPAYVPPSGDALIFGGEQATGPIELSAQCALSITATAALRLVHLAAATVDLGITATAIPGGVFFLSADIALPVSAAAAATLVVAFDPVTVTLQLTATAETAPSWYVPRPFGGSTRARWNDAARAEHRSLHPYIQAPPIEPQTALPWGEQQRIEQHLAAIWADIPPCETGAAAPWADLAEKPQRAAGLGYTHPSIKNYERMVIPWGGMLDPLAATLAASYLHPARNERAEVISWDDFGEPLSATLSLPHSHPPPKDVEKPIISGPYWYPRWCINRYDAPDGSRLVFAAVTGNYQPPQGAALVFADLSANYPRHCFDGTWNGPKDPYWYKPRNWSIAQPNIRRVYLVMNTVSLTRLIDSVPIPVETLAIASTRDSWAWTLSATLVRKADLDLVRPTGGAPVEVEATINGLTWRFAIEEYGEEIRFGQRAYSATGRSLAAYLADPYSAPRDHVQLQQRSAQQLAEEELTDTGFSLVWTLPEWLIPGGVWSYQGQTPIQAIAQIAAAAGGVVQSHPSTRQLQVQPWYPTLPWAWGGLIIDAAVPAAMIDSRRARFEPRPAYTGVYCRGQQQGVTAFIRRTGTDGSRLAGQQVHSLITATEPGLALGKKILADSGPRSIETLNLPLLDNPGLLAPGALIEVQDTTTWYGQIISTNINAQRPAVNQTVNVLRYHGS
jgi:hypothetical protein